MEGDEKLQKAFRRIKDRLDLLDRKLNENSKPNPLSETWLDTQETCQLLKISKRTLQAYRINGTLPFSTLGGKVYFRASDIDKHLNKNYVHHVDGR